MPRPSKGARLYTRTRRGKTFFVIRDGEREISTGTGDRKEAERHLASYIEARERPRGPATAEGLTCAEALDIYGAEYATTVAAPDRIGYAIQALVPFWGELPISDVRGATCRRYTAWRDKAPGTVRRELGVLEAAINYCATEGYLLSAPKVWKPPAPPTKDRWLTRGDVAIMLAACRRLRVDGRHLSKFILAALYTGTRKSATLGLRIDQPSTTGGHIDTVNGILYRRGAGEAETNKRQRPARVPRQLLAHVRRWKARGCRWVVETNEGHGVADIRKGWAGMLAHAESIAEKHDLTFDPNGVTPHVLRHTAITWAMQRGAEIADVSSYFGVSLETLQKTYWHHHPDHQKSAVAAMESRVSGAVPRNYPK